MQEDSGFIFIYKSLRSTEFYRFTTSPNNEHYGRGWMYCKDAEDTAQYFLDLRGHVVKCIPMLRALLVDGSLPDDL